MKKQLKEKGVEALEPRFSVGKELWLCISLKPLSPRILLRYLLAYHKVIPVLVKPNNNCIVWFVNRIELVLKKLLQTTKEGSEGETEVEPVVANM